MNEYIESNGLKIATPLYELLENKIAPGTDVNPDDFWAALAKINKKLGPENKALLEKRNDLQKKIDDWYIERKGHTFDAVEHQNFLKEIGYLLPEGDNFKVTTSNVDCEITTIAGPQLVVPVDKSRYALNAANARWGSLYDALYGTDLILEVEGCKRTKKYNPVRGAKVIKYVRNFLDTSVPMAIGSHGFVVQYKVRSGKLIGIMGDGTESGLGKRERFVGYTGEPESPKSIFLSHNHMYIEICLGEGFYIGRGDLAGVYDVKLESAVSTIMDCEDSVAAVDAEDKTQVYSNWLGLMKGNLKLTIVKENETIERSLAPDRNYTSPDGKKCTLRSRSLMLCRNVGIHMYTDAVMTTDGEQIPEGFLDAMMTVLIAKHDLLGKGNFRNSLEGSVYIVKPKLHGPEEVASTVKLFELVEQALGLEKNTVKIGIMDEERRTTVNLKECIRVAKERVIFINTGFLDRTGDEIHTSMQAAAVMKKKDLKSATWLLAYEDWNVDVGLETGLPGHAQIGKGMWAEPENMANMMEAKINHPRAGASTAWVPSPTAATLHAMHYHRVDVHSRQQELCKVTRSNLNDILTIPVLEEELTDAEIRAEIENNAQGILGYVVRWIDQGVGCSKVPDINNVSLMEDRATLRISSQHISNWLHHELVTPKQVVDVFQKMAAIVDFQNANDPLYKSMSPDFDNNIAFKAALDLVFTGCSEASGYTEKVLHARRREAKLKEKHESLFIINNTVRQCL
ncbi:MAG TPA: malate synthase G [Thiotrichaceae bacterium]|jgi:malate synthase|nr:malate synthase G [Thiotrichaceae bacterium]HIM07513.1 malate synthase G [Gammaproteobacteria bacterium]